MKYLNEFHKKTTEACLKKMAEWKKTPIDSKKEAERMRWHISL